MSGTVKVYLDSEEISSTKSYKEVNFEFTDGQELKIEEGFGIIFFDYFKEYPCPCKHKNNFCL